MSYYRRPQRVPEKIADIPEFPKLDSEGRTRLLGFCDLDEEWHEYPMNADCYTEAHAPEQRAWADPVLAGVPLQRVGPIVEVVEQGNDTWVICKHEGTVELDLGPDESDLVALYRQLVDDIIEQSRTAQNADDFFSWLRDEAVLRADELKTQ